MVTRASLSAASVTSAPFAPSQTLVNRDGLASPASRRASSGAAGLASPLTAAGSVPHCSLTAATTVGGQ